MKRLPLRSLLLGSVLTVMAAGFLFFSIYVDRVENTNRVLDIDSELVRAERLAALEPSGGSGLDSDSSGGPPPGGPPPGGASDQTDSLPQPDADEAPVQVLVDSDGELIADGGLNPFSQETIDELIAQDGYSTVGDPSYRVKVATQANGDVAVTALSLQGLEIAASRLRRALALGAIAIGALVAALLWALTGFLVRPVTKMATVASKIASGELDTPVGCPGGSRETAQLAIDLDQMLSSLRTSLEKTERSAAKATAARDDMERFLADMAHELKTPLTALKGYSDLYASGMLNEASGVDRAMSRIGSESERLHSLVVQMLQLARKTAANEPDEAFAVSAVAEEVAEDLRAAYPDQRFDVEQSESQDCNVRAVRSQIHQAILNLGSNACHHNQANEPVLIRVEVGNEVVAVSVIDRGPGVDPKDYERIFLPFFRAEICRSRTGSSGAGLGLALTKQIADQHDTKVVVSETLGGGATFTLALPRVKADAKYP